MSDCLSIYAAGSLRDPFEELASFFRQAQSLPVEMTFGPAGLLAQQLKSVSGVDLFASANARHPDELVSLGIARDPQVFTHNRLCLTMRDTPEFTSKSWLSLLLERKWIISTSTPGADPGGDYAVALFDEIEKHYPGKGVELKQRAQPLLGKQIPDRHSSTQPSSTQPKSAIPAGAALVLTGRSDIHIGYASHKQKTDNIQGVSTLDVPALYNPIANYTMVTLRSAHPATTLFRQLIMSPIGQDILLQHGFNP